MVTTDKNIDRLLKELKNQESKVMMLKPKIYSEKMGFFLTTKNKKDFEQYIKEFDKRTEIEKALVRKFNERHYHDFMKLTHAERKMVTKFEKRYHEG